MMRSIDGITLDNNFNEDGAQNHHFVPTNHIITEHIKKKKTPNYIRFY